MIGSVALILTAHVPYVRAAGRDPVGEDALHETIAYSLVPTLNVLFDLRGTGVRPHVALAYSPILLEQLADPVVQKHFVVWMDAWLERVQAELEHQERDGTPHQAYLARFYLDWGQTVLQSFETRFGRNLTTALRELCESGLAEPLAGAATHAYLPLLGRPEALRAQLEVGAHAVTRRLGRRPRGFWLPEQGYAPALNQHIVSTGARYMVVAPSSLADSSIPHLRPRWVLPRQLIALISDPAIAMHVSAGELGYQADPLYLAPQREASGLAWQRNGLVLPDALYDPYHAFRRAREHAAHCAAAMAAELAEFHRRHDRPGIVVLPLDADQLGRSWFEGPSWLRSLLEAVEQHPEMALALPSSYMRSFRPRQGAALREGSWDDTHLHWSAPPSAALQQALEEATDRLVALVQRFPDAGGAQERALAQAARELLLAQSSDWPLLVNHGYDVREGIGRPLLHLQRCEQLCALAEQPAFGEDALRLLDELEEFDNPFPYLNYRIFAT